MTDGTSLQEKNSGKDKLCEKGVDILEKGPSFELSSEMESLEVGSSDQSLEVQPPVRESKGDIKVTYYLRDIKPKMVNAWTTLFKNHENRVKISSEIFSEGHLKQMLWYHQQIVLALWMGFIPTLSDCHCKLEWELSAKYCVPGENDIPIQLKNMTPNYIWTDCSAIKFQETLSSDTLQNYILEFNNSTIQFTQTSVDDASSKLSNIFLSAANLSLKRPLKKHTNKQKNKKWFDASLQQARTNLLNYGKIYSRFPYDPIIKNHFYKLNREYSKLRKYKYKQYKQSLISQLDSLHEENPKLYWNLINELQEKNETKKKCGVQPSTLISHFQKLSQLKGEFQSRYTELCEKLKQLENSKCFNELDSFITESEISKAISHLKCNKSSGLDNITFGKEPDEEIIENMKKCNLCGGRPIKFLISAPTMRVPKDVISTSNAFLAFRATIIAVEKHNRNPENEPIRSVLCPGLGTAVGRMPFDRCAFQELGYKPPKMTSVTSSNVYDI
ncbi:unnamed protein product [Mytilus edulis]|uniref:Macro domain-containing protein n=1 Tax=Mytilus edulis TaxID=6550 RepID=A0A8S3R515_MYTED|nr:unnamed protein product [Mytilus edulis]